MHRLDAERREATEDEKRIDYVRQALGGVLDAVADGVDVRGYTYWSLLDNFEWALGYRPRFGIVSVDRATFARMAKPSAAWLASSASVPVTSTIPCPDSTCQTTRSMASEKKAGNRRLARADAAVAWWTFTPALWGSA